MSWARPIPSCRALSPGSRFPDPERRHLLTSPGLGPVVVERLEEAGIASLALLHQIGVDTVVGRMCQPGTNLAWRNRRKALQRALSSFGG